MQRTLGGARSLAALFSLMLTLAACGGGGDGGGSTPPPTAQASVSGTVQAPGGQVAIFSQPTLWDRIGTLFWPEAVAALSGLSPVPDGTPLQLVRISDTGDVVANLASTAVSGGQYSFNLTSLGLSPAGDLVVRVINSGTGAQLRAFVTGSTVDLNPISETAVRLVLQQIVLTPGTTLDHFTLTELRDISGSVNQLTTVKQVSAGLNIETTIASIMNLVTSEPEIISFITATAGAGQTDEGPGDIGNYFPLIQGNTLQFQGTYSVTGQPPVNFSNTMMVSGTKAVGAVTTTILAESNPLNSGVPEEVYHLKDSRGIWNYGNNDSSDALSPNLTPYRELLFPLNLGVTSEVVNRKGVNYGQDLDLDGKNETADILSQVTVEAFEDVTVPKGTFVNTARVIHKATITVFSSAGFGSVTATGTQTVWFAPNLGPVKRATVFQSEGQPTESSSEELVDVLTAKQISLVTNDLIYDPKTQTIYASLPGSPGSIRSINPTTGDIGPPIPVGNEPLKLAISDNGQYLYVGLDGEAAVQRIDLTTQTAGMKFSLGSNAASTAYYVEDIEVLPGSSDSVAISRRYKAASPRHAGVAIYDNGVQRPTTTPDHTGSNVIEFSALPSRLYGYNQETTEFGFRRMTVDASGVTVFDVFDSFMGDLITGFGVDIKFDGGLIYTTSGRVIDPEARTVVGTFSLPVTLGNLVKPDSATGQVFFLTEGGPLGTWSIRSFDTTTRQLIGSENIPGVAGTPGSLIRWGPTGLAFRTTGGQVFLIESLQLSP